MYPTFSTCLESPISHGVGRDAGVPHAPWPGDWLPRELENMWNEEGIGKPEEPEVRRDLVARIRREIATGTYETPEKWEIALDRLLRLRIADCGLRIADVEDGDQE
jgi:hypothetical protein